MLLDAQAQIRIAQGRFALVIPPGPGAVARVADLIRLADLVPISGTLEGAMATVSEPPDGRSAQAPGSAGPTR